LRLYGLGEQAEEANDREKRKGQIEVHAEVEVGHASREPALGSRHHRGLHGGEGSDHPRVVRRFALEGRGRVANGQDREREHRPVEKPLHRRG